MEKNTDLLACQSPDALIAALQTAAQKYREDACELQSAWRDDSAGKIWESAAMELDRVALKLGKQWAKA